MRFNRVSNMLIMTFSNQVFFFLKKMVNYVRDITFGTILCHNSSHNEL